MQERKIRITNNSGKTVNIINGNETVTLSHSEVKVIYAKEETFSLCYDKPKKLSLKVLNHPDISLKNMWRILIGFLLFFNCKVKTESCYNDIVVEERNYSYGNVFLFAALKVNLDCEYSLIWQSQKDKKICTLILYVSSIIWCTVLFLFSAVGISLIIEEFSLEYVLTFLIFFGLFLLNIYVFRTHKSFLNISENTEKMLLESDMITIIESSKHYIKFRSVEE